MIVSAKLSLHRGGETLRIQINGESREVGDQSTLGNLVNELSLPPARIAIELNGEVVRRNDWANTLVADGDRLEIVHFVGGGSPSATPKRVSLEFKL